MLILSTLAAPFMDPERSKDRFRLDTQSCLVFFFQGDLVGSFRFVLEYREKKPEARAKGTSKLWEHGQRSSIFLPGDFFVAEAFTVPMLRLKSWRAKIGRASKQGKGYRGQFVWGSPPTKGTTVFLVSC